jgi:hypothetical protein
MDASFDFDTAFHPDSHLRCFQLTFRLRHMHLFLLRNESRSEYLHDDIKNRKKF